jgi:hypothetical protein
MQGQGTLLGLFGSAIGPRGLASAYGSTRRLKQLFAKNIMTPPPT